MPDTDSVFMSEALELARRAESEGEVPVGALLTLDGKVMGQGWNRVIGLADPSAHAEILALREAGSTMGNYRLPGSTLYVTLEPCCMCVGAIVHARVARLVYAAGDPKTGAVNGQFELLQSPQHNHRVEVASGVLAEEASGLLVDFFRRRR
jgi:tRNA(adenine34) deaminase